MPPRTARSIADAGNITVPSQIFDIEHLYGDYLDNIERDGTRQGVFHPSAVGMCGRMNVYEFTYAKQDLHSTSGKSLEIFELGHHVHAIVQGRFHKMSEWAVPSRGVTIRFWDEVRFDPETDVLFAEYGIGGTTDGIIEITGPGWVQRSILEIKSIAKDAFEDLKAPKPEHLEQATLYAYRFDCPIIYIWYYCKNNSERKVFARAFDQEVLDTALSKYRGWVEHAIAGTLPDRQESYFGCRECTYHDICKPSIRKNKTGAAVVQRVTRPVALTKRSR